MNYSEAGSVLIYPFFTLHGAAETTICVTDTADGPFNQLATWIRLNVICKGEKGPNPFCDGFAAHFPLSYHATRCINLATDLQFTPPCKQGFVIAFAETAGGRPQSYNALNGHAQIFIPPAVLMEQNALAVKSLANYRSLLGGPTGEALTFGTQGTPPVLGDYAALPATLLGTFRATNASAPAVSTYLILFTLETILAGQNPLTRAQLTYWSANEIRFSTAHEFVCWDAVPLADIDSRFTMSGLGTAVGSLQIKAASLCPLPQACPPLAFFTPTIHGALVDVGPGAALGVRNLFNTGARSTVYFPE